MKPILPLLPLALLLLSGCTSVPSITYDYVPGTDFSSYRTFAAHPQLSLSRPPGAGPTLAARVETAVHTALASKGFSPAEESEADFLVMVHGRLDQHVNIIDFGYELPIGPWRHGGYWGPAWHARLWGSEAIVTNVGRLAVDIIDRRSRRLVWRGIARREGIPDQPDAGRLAAVVEQVLSAFPPSDLGPPADTR